MGLDRLSESCSAIAHKAWKQKLVNQQQKQILFKIGDRVMAFDDDGGTVYGTVKWIGRSVGSVDKLIGIETVSAFIYIAT